MLQFDGIDMEVFYERQVVFNSDLKVIMRYEDSKKQHTDYYAYINSHHGGSVTWEGVEHSTPWCELLIVRQFVNHFFYKIALICAEHIMPRKWQKVGEAIRAELKRFEEERGLEGSLCPKIIEETHRQSKAETRDRKKFSPEIKERYKTLQDRIREMLKNTQDVALIAKELGLHVQVVKIQGLLMQKRPEVAEVAAMALLSEMQKSGLAKKLRIQHLDGLKDEILNRTHENTFRKRKTVTASKKPFFVPDRIE